MTSQIRFASSRLIKRIAARAVAIIRKIATHRKRQKKIQHLRDFIEELPVNLPFSGPDLVMGCACGYEIDSVRPFVESLFGSGRFRGEVVIFLGPEDKALRAYLEEVGIKAVSLEIQDDYPSRAPKRARYFAYFKYLHHAVQSGCSYRCILLTDVRDVIFQGPLFETPSFELELYCEHLSPIGACQINSQWISKQFGRRALASLADKRISCSGTVSGRTRGILEYLVEMQIILLALRPTVRMTHGDQGVHNYVLHSGLLPQARLLENFERVATLHHVPGALLHIDSVGRLVNPDGSISEIVHQYDRHAQLFHSIQKSFTA